MLELNQRIWAEIPKYGWFLMSPEETLKLCWVFFFQTKNLLQLNVSEHPLPDFISGQHLRSSEDWTQNYTMAKIRITSCFGLTWFCYYKVSLKISPASTAFPTDTGHVFPCKNWLMYMYNVLV